MTNRFPNPEPQYVDQEGLPLASGKLYFYVTGSSTPLATYTDPDLDPSHQNTNPVILNAYGAPPQAIFLQLAPYKVVLTDANDNEIWTADPVSLSDYTTVAQFAGHAGDPNGSVAGTAASGSVPASVIWDYTNNVLYVCTTTGTSSTAVWTAVAAQFAGSIIFSSVITPTQLAANTNNWAPTGFASTYAVRASASSAISLTGIAGGVSGREILLSNIGSYVITLVSNSTSSTAGNRFIMPRPVALRPSEAISLSFDGTSNGWVPKAPIQTQPVAGGAGTLVVTVTTNSVATLTANALTLEDANGLAYRATGVSLSTDISASGANGLDTGAEASNTWYAYWAIFNPSSNTVAGLFSLSSTFAGLTLPSGYTFGARFGWVRNDNSSNLFRTKQFGNRAQYIVGTNPTGIRSIATGTAGSTTVPTWVALDITGYVPTASASRIIGSLRAGAVNSNVAAIAAPNNSYGGLSNDTSPPFVSSAQFSVSTTGIGIPFEMVLESTSIYWASDNADNGIFCTGWVDNL